MLRVHVFRVVDRSQQEVLALLPICLESVAFVLITACNAERGKGVSRTMDCFHDRIAGCLIDTKCPWPVCLINPRGYQYIITTHVANITCHAASYSPGFAPVWFVF